VEAGEETEKGGLPASRRARHRDELTGGHVGGDAVQDRHPAGTHAEPHRELADLDPSRRGPEVILHFGLSPGPGHAQAPRRGSWPWAFGVRGRGRRRRRRVWWWPSGTASPPATGSRKTRRGRPSWTPSSVRRDTPTAWSTPVSAATPRPAGSAGWTGPCALAPRSPSSPSAPTTACAGSPSTRCVPTWSRSWSVSPPAGFACS